MQKLFIIQCESIHSSSKFTQNSRMKWIFTWHRFHFSTAFFTSFCLWPSTFINLKFEDRAGRRQIIVLITNHPETLVHSISWIVYYCVWYLELDSVKLFCLLWGTRRVISWIFHRFPKISSFLIDSSQMHKILRWFIKLQTVWF